MRKKIVVTSIVLTLSMTTLFGCSSRNKDEKETTTAEVTTKAEETTESTTIAVSNTSDKTEVEAEGFDDEDYTRVLVSDDEDAGEDGVTVIKSTTDNTIYLKDSNVESSVEGVTVDGTVVTITAPGTYIITGSLTDGQIVVDCAEKGTVEIVLNNANISNSTNSPIYVKDSKKTLLVLAEESVNTLNDADTYNYEDTENEEPSACLFSKEDLVISGEGSLTVNANFNNGIASKDTLKITGGTITVNAANNGIKGKDCLLIAGGTFSITSEGDSLKAENANDTNLGYITITGGDFTLVSESDGIQASQAVNITGGTFDITTGDGAGNTSSNNSEFGGFNYSSTSEAAEVVSTKGIKGETAINITGGTITANTEDDAIHSGGTVDITGGNLELSAGDDGIHADGTLTIAGGNVNILKSYEGVESPEIIFDGGTTYITASDDGTNAAGGSTSSTTSSGPGGMMSSSTGTLTINDGYLHVNASGDGLDANGDLTINGGTTIVEGPTDDGNTAVDYDGSFNMNGGYLLASGSSGMVEGVSSTSKENNVTAYFTSALSTGSTFAVLDSDGNTVMAFEVSKTSECFVFASPDLVTGETYTIQTGGTCSGTSKDGLYTDGTYSGGTELDSFTISSVVTTVGTGGGMAGGAPSGNMGGPGRR